jgi:hypothetical protein
VQTAWPDDLLLAGGKQSRQPVSSAQHNTGPAAAPLSVKGRGESATEFRNAIAGSVTSSSRHLGAPGGHEQLLSRSEPLFGFTSSRVASTAGAA